MLLLMPLALLVAATGSAAESLSDKIAREYVQPALEQVQGAVDGREPNWTPPVLPGTAETAALSEKVRKLWLDPLMDADQGYALAAARSLASPKVFEPPAEPDLAAILPVGSISPVAESFVSTVERKFLSRLFPEDYAFKAAAALGSGRAGDAGPSAPDQSDLARLPDLASAGPRFAKPEDFTAKRRVADSTKLTRGSSASSAAAPRLKPFSSSLSLDP
ncbi:MAG TPA: hypothetical protein VH309_01655 [Elusimicrobiota bacterium]|jgi:hypothetical protein|nr:hypothetical protein [Elusimicrobiota bacterium]